jgi:hypothetical protein
MPITTLSSRELERGTSRPKTAARHGPVCSSDRWRPTHVLLAFDDA